MAKRVKQKGRGRRAPAPYSKYGKRPYDYSGLSQRPVRRVVAR